MDKKLKKDMRVIQMMKALLASYVVTGVLLAILAAMLFGWNLDEAKVSFGIMAIYVLSTFLGGLIIGKITGQKRYLWGTLLGICYFLLLALISFGIYRTFKGSAMNIFTTFLLCAGGGMFGGMVS